MQRAIALSITLVTMLGGCAADSGDEGIFVLKNVAAATGCVVSATESETGISHGSLDLSFPTSYLFIAQMKSRITALDGQLDQRTVITSGAKIDIEFPNTTIFSETELAGLKTEGLTHFKQLFSSPIRPNGGLTDAGFQLIPAELTARIAAKSNLSAFGLEAVATLTIVGDMSGQEVTSQPFSFPVTLGHGIAVVDNGACPMTGMPRAGYACNPLQDGIVDCCTDPRVVTPFNPSGFVCPARTM